MKVILCRVNFSVAFTTMMEIVNISMLLFECLMPELVTNLSKNHTKTNDKNRR